jgi:hypothetical protein
VAAKWPPRRLTPAPSGPVVAARAPAHLTSKLLEVYVIRAYGTVNALGSLAGRALFSARERHRLIEPPCLLADWLIEFIFFVTFWGLVNGAPFLGRVSNSRHALRSSVVAGCANS